MKKTGFLAGGEYAPLVRSDAHNDLIWNYVVSSWLMGEDPPAFDILSWNADSTRMPAEMHSFYLRSCYLENQLARGAMELAGQQLELAAVDQDLYFLAAEQDHIAPWRSSYQGALLPAGQVRFVLSNAGHIAGIVNPPNPKSDAPGGRGRRPAAGRPRRVVGRATTHPTPGGRTGPAGSRPAPAARASRPGPGAANTGRWAMPRVRMCWSAEVVLRFGLFGCGRIGRVHADSIAAHPRAELAIAYDPLEPAAQDVTTIRWDADHRPRRDLDRPRHRCGDHRFADRDPHRTAGPIRPRRQGRAVRSRSISSLTGSTPVGPKSPRSTPRSWSASIGGSIRRSVRTRRILADEIGRLEQLIITSRDPAPAPAAYIASSGGLFRDMTIHDFDLVRFFVGEVVEVQAMGANLIEPYIGKPVTSTVR